MRFLPAVRAFLKEESGQTTIEYILMVVLVVTVAMQMRKKMFSFITKLMNAIDEKSDGILDDPSDAT